MTGAAAGTGPGASADLMTDRVRASLREAGWEGTHERLLAGVSHHLNGLAGALSGLVELSGSERGRARNLSPYFRDESERLIRLAALMTRLALRSGKPQTFRAADVLDELLALHRLHRGLEEHTPVPDVALPDAVVRTSEALFGRVVLLLLADAGWRTVPTDRRPEMAVAIDGDALLVTLGGPEGPEGWWHEAPVPPDAPARLEAAAAAMGAELEEGSEAGEWWLRLRIPRVTRDP